MLGKDFSRKWGKQDVKNFSAIFSWMAMKFSLFFLAEEEHNDAVSFLQ